MATCYRHSDRETGVSCSNCGRPICPDCMTPTPVGMRCPECARQRTKSANPVRGSRPGAVAAGDLPVTKALIAVNVLAYLAELASGSGGLNGVGGTVADKGGLFGPYVADGEYWRLLTSGFLHASIIHIGFNMYLLWVLGQMIEPALGSLRFGVVYFAALFAGSLGALLLSPHAFTVGASGAIFGLMGAAFVELRRRGIDPFQAGIGWLIVINLGLSLVLSNISIGGHLGGLAGGALAMLALHEADRRRRSAAGLAAAGAIGAACAVAAVAFAQTI